MAKFKKLMLLCTSILMCCMMTAFVGCSLFGPIDSSTDSNSQTQESPSDTPCPSDTPGSSDTPGPSDTPGSGDSSSSDDPANGGNWTGEAPLN